MKRQKTKNGRGDFLNVRKCFDETYCIANGNEMNYDGELILLKPDSLSDKYKEWKYQLWIAFNGNGCTFGAKGQGIDAICIADGEKAHWERADFLGIVDLDKIPDSTIKAYEKYKSEDEYLAKFIPAESEDMEV